MKIDGSMFPQIKKCLRCDNWGTWIGAFCPTCQAKSAIADVDKNADPVHSPSHYTKGGIETISYIRAKLTKEEFIGYCMGNVIKYTSRYKDKNGEQDLKKAGVYLEWALERMGQDN